MTPTDVEIAGHAISWILALTVFGVALFVFILWVLLPVFVYRGLNRLERILSQIERNTQQK